MSFSVSGIHLDVSKIEFSAYEILCTVLCGSLIAIISLLYLWTLLYSFIKVCWCWVYLQHSLQVTLTTDWSAAPRSDCAIFGMAYGFIFRLAAASRVGVLSQLLQPPHKLSPFNL
jgi:hypothetical protein